MAKNYKQVNDEKPSFIMYKSWEEAFELLSIEEQAQMMKNLFLWHRNEEPVLNTQSLKLVWKLIEFNLIHNAENYDKRSETSSKNGKSGGAPKGNKNALKEKYDIEEQPNQPIFNLNQPITTYNNPNDNGNVNGNGNGNVNGNDNDKDNDKDKVIANSSYKNIIQKSILDILTDYDVDIKKYNDAIEEYNELGGIEYIADIMEWDNSVKLKWNQKIINVNAIK